MENQSFYDYLASRYSAKNSGTVHSYTTAIRIIDEIFFQKDVFGLNGKSISELRDPVFVAEIIDFIVEKEAKFRNNPESSIFHLGKENQKSYPDGRFCSGAIRQLGKFVDSVCCKESVVMMSKYKNKGEKLSKRLIDKFNINKHETEKEAVVKRRIGQDIFRSMLLKIYNSKCCLTGLDVPEVLRASHILPWADSKKNRLNPENGLCLSATYDAAFDKHLISFDEDYRLLLSKELKDHYSSEAFKTHFLNFEGKAIQLPSMYLPSKAFLAQHRDKLRS